MYLYAFWRLCVNIWLPLPAGSDMAIDKSFHQYDDPNILPTQPRNGWRNTEHRFKSSWELVMSTKKLSLQLFLQMSPNLLGPGTVGAGVSNCAWYFQDLLLGKGGSVYSWLSGQCIFMLFKDAMPISGCLCQELWEEPFTRAFNKMSQTYTSKSK